MGSPAVFAGKFTKLLTSRGLLNSNGNINENNGPKDYMLNGTFETGTVSPWTAVSTTFTNGVPGALSIGAGSLTLALNSTATLSGSNDLIVTKPASNCQGSGFASGVLTVDKEDSAKMLFGSFSYQCSNTNFDASGTSTQSFEIWIYDVTASAWIQPIGYRGMNQNSGVGKVTFSFQTPGTNATNQYRVCVFTNQTSALGYAVEFDNFALGPQSVVTGLSGSDLGTIAWTPIITGATTNPTFGTLTTQYKAGRLADRAVLSFNFSQSSAGTAGSGSYLITIPGGLSIDPNKVVVNTNGTLATNLGSVNFYSAPGTPNNQVQGFVYAHSSNQLALSIGGSNIWGSAYGALSSANVNVTFNIEVPISGWSSNVQMSSDSSAAVVALGVGLMTAQSVAANAVIKFDTIVTDKTGNYSTSTGLFTAPVSGIYAISMQGSVTGGVSPYLKIGGVSSGYFYSANPGVGSSTLIREVLAGQTIGAYSDGAVTFHPAGPNGSNNNLSIARLSGNNAVAQVESVNFKGVQTSAQSFTANTQTTVNLNSKLWDSHNGLNTSTGVWTCPVSGKYRVSGGVAVDSSQAGFFTIIYHARGAANIDSVWFRTGVTSSSMYSALSSTFNMLAGDTLYMAHQTGSSVSTVADARTHLEAERVGN